MQVLLFLSLLAFALAQRGGWTAKFEMTSTAPNSGVSTGAVSWRWAADDSAQTLTRYLFELKFDVPGSSQKTTELYQYNNGGGYGGDATGQTRFLDDQSCNPGCATTGILPGAPAMPPMAPKLLSASYYSNPPTSGNCQVYTPATKSVVSSFRATPSNGEICSFIMNDGCIQRTFVLSNYVYTNTPPTISRPEGCSCNSVLDIMIVLDRSSSIQPVQTKLFHNFVTNFLKQLKISPENVNVGMVWFHSSSGRQFLMQGNPQDIAKAVANCSKTPPDVQIGGCAVSDNAVPWPTPCNSVTNPARICNNGNIAFTSTHSGVLLGGAVMFSSSRKVPKLFITMTDGAVNKLISDTDASQPWGGALDKGPSSTSDCSILATKNGNVVGTDGANCTKQLKTVMQTLKNQHAAWKTAVGCAPGQCDLTLISVGVGIKLYDFCDKLNPQSPPGWIDDHCSKNSAVGGSPSRPVCYDPNYCLSTQHLDILGGGGGAYNGPANPNVLTADNWVTLNNDFIPKLLALSCPSGDYIGCQCGTTCPGFCSGPCNNCVPPVKCQPESNLCFTVDEAPVGGKLCPKVNRTNPCPTKSCNCRECVSYTCNPAGNGGQGSCDKITSPGVPCAPPAGTRCATTICKADGKCDGTDITQCPPCSNTEIGACIGASCGTPGKKNITKVRNGDFCTDAGAVTVEPCCGACDCTFTQWTQWSAECTAVCTAGNQVVTRNRVKIPANCSGSDAVCEGLPVIDEKDCSDCSPKDCSVSWGSWSCDCVTGLANRSYEIIVNPAFNGTECPNEQQQLCSCCVPEWTATSCDCDTNTKTRTWRRAVLANGSGVDCVEPVPSVIVETCAVPPACAICEGPEDCDDGDGCTDDICDNVNGTETTGQKHCRNPVKDCTPPTASRCFTTSCDANLGGCVTTPSAESFCDDGNLCTTDYCDDLLGCQYNTSALALNCSKDPALNDCNYAFCDPLTGCGIINIQCNTTENCTIAGCDPNWNSTDPDYEPLCQCEEDGGPTGPCYSYPICALDTALVIGLTAGAIAALVVCLAFLAFLILSGGTYALATQVKSGEDASMSNNPLYQDKGTHGTNALHAGGLD